MKKLFGLLLIVAVAIVAIPIARSFGVLPAPPGISTNDWIPLGETAGFVITRANGPLGEQSKPGFVRGYFMVRQASAWLRVESDLQSQLHPATLAQ
jgi:hypothetical protein